jgi:hypothetical protein
MWRATFHSGTWFREAFLLNSVGSITFSADWADSYDWDPRLAADTDINDNVDSWI